MKSFDKNTHTHKKILFKSDFLNGVIVFKVLVVWGPTRLKKKKCYGTLKYCRPYVYFYFIHDYFPELFVKY